MKTDTANRILAIIRKNGSASPRGLCDVLGISPQAVHRQLLKLQKDGSIRKLGGPPKVRYALSKQEEGKPKEKWAPSEADSKYLEQNFYLITPDGMPLTGTEAFVYWCHQRSLPPEKTLGEYKTIREKYNHCRKEHLIDGMRKMKSTFKTVYLDELYYLDFYQIDRFGKTKLGTLMLYSKQNQDAKLMCMIADLIREPIHNLIRKNDFDAVCFIPPTVKRTVQFMNELKKNLALPLPVTTLEKIRTKIVVPQKTLTKLEDRIINAQTTLHAPKEEVSSRHILLIDDAIGSGATMNEAAHILKRNNHAKKITGLGLTGSPSGFDVISEV